MAGIQTLQYYVGGSFLPLLHIGNIEKEFTSSLEAYFSYHEADKGYYFTFIIVKFPSESSLKIKVEKEER